MSASSSQWWLVRFVVALATLLFFAPLLSIFPSLVIPSPYPDALEFIWTTWRMSGVLEGNRDLYVTREVYAPEGASLLLHTVCEGVLLPVTFALQRLGPVWCFNCAIILLFLINGLAAISFVRVLGGSPWVTGIAALLIVFAPFQMGHLLAGHLNFLVLFPFLEVCTTLIACGSSAITGGQLGIYALRLVGALFLLGRTNLYYLYFAGFLIGAFSLRYAFMWQVMRPRLLFMWGVCVVGVLSNARHLSRIASLALSKRYTPDHDPMASSADVLAYLVPSSLQVLGTLPSIAMARVGVVFHEGETSLFVGSMLLVAVAISFLFRRSMSGDARGFFLALACSGFILSLGPVVSFAGKPLFPNLVDYLARSVLPLYPSVPARFGLFVVIFLIAYVVAGGRLNNNPRTRYVIAIILALCLLEIFPSRISLTEVVVSSPALERLRSDSSVRIVVDQPIITQQAMLRQIAHEKPIVGGFLSRRPRKIERELRSNPFVQSVTTRPGRHAMQSKRAGWCKLGADALILETSQAQALLPELTEIGLSMVDSDERVWIFKPRVELCVNTLSGSDAGS